MKLELGQALGEPKNRQEVPRAVAQSNGVNTVEWELYGEHRKTDQILVPDFI